MIRIAGNGRTNGYGYHKARIGLTLLSSKSAGTVMKQLLLALYSRGHNMKKILLLQGANLTYLGKREPQIYGTTTPDQLNALLYDHAKKNTYHLEIFYTNFEGEAIEKIYEAAESGYHGLVMNPAGFSYAGYALKDCVKGANLPYVEIHISNIESRHLRCVLSDISEGMITGFGMHGYILALDAMLEILKKRNQK